MISEQMPVQSDNDIFTQEEMLYQYEQATTGQRFLNFLIDMLLVRYGLSWVMGFALGVIIVAISEELYYDMFYGISKTQEFFLNYLIGNLGLLLYYTICEKTCRGYTLGKLITGTRAIQEDGNELTLRNAFLRSLSRIVPFEAFSAFGGYPWHDQWTKTMVIKTR